MSLIINGVWTLFDSGNHLDITATRDIVAGTDFPEDIIITVCVAGGGGGASGRINSWTSRKGR